MLLLVLAEYKDVIADVYNASNTIKGLADGVLEYFCRAGYSKI